VRKVRYEPVPISEVIPFLLAQPPSATMAILFAGDRLSCCDEAIVARCDGKIFGIATIAPEGEMRSGNPTIVGVYVVPHVRGLGIGSQLFQSAIRRCVEQSLTPVRIDALTDKMARLCDALPDGLKSVCHVVKHADWGVIH
jgi:GNAT superfamily N-acetyltransferase